eukprot:364890-Chlamydomonas_euryale.AAC.4
MGMPLVMAGGSGSQTVRPQPQHTCPLATCARFACRFLATVLMSCAAAAASACCAAAAAC